MRRVALIPVLLVMAAVASSASVATTGVRIQTNSRITSLTILPVSEKRLSPERNVAQPTRLPAFQPDAHPLLTEFYGPAKTAPAAPAKAAAPVSVPEASIVQNSHSRSR
jgi:hypothetical protein